MKLKKNEITSKELHQRLIRSILLGVIFMTTVALGLYFVKESEEVDGAPALIRSAHLFNEEVFKILHSNKRLSVEKPKPPRGTKPRVNGLVGLNSSVDLINYHVQIISGNNTLSLPIGAFMVLPKVGYSTNFKCIEGWSEVIQYAGARFSEFLDFYQIGKKMTVLIMPMLDLRRRIGNITYL